MRELVPRGFVATRHYCNNEGQARIYFKDNSFLSLGEKNKHSRSSGTNFSDRGMRRYHAILFGLCPNQSIADVNPFKK
jgi:hypothetical protein